MGLGQRIDAGDFRLAKKREALWTEFRTLLADPATKATVSCFIDTITVLSKDYVKHGKLEGWRALINDLKSTLGNETSPRKDEIEKVFAMLIKSFILLFYRIILLKTETFDTELSTLCQRLAEEIVTTDLDENWQRVEAHTKRDAFYFLSLMLREAGEKKARIQYLPCDLRQPDILKGMDYLASAILLSLNDHNADLDFRYLDFAKSLQQYMPLSAEVEQKTMARYLGVIEKGILYFEAQCDQEKIAEMTLILVKLLQKQNKGESLYWFMRAGDNGVVFKEEDYHVFTTLSEASKEPINITFVKLQALTNANITRFENQPEKKAIFTKLHDILTQDETDESPVSRILKFQRAMKTADQQIISSHDKPAWRRFVENALSFIALLIPAIIRAHKSNAMYGTCRFWQPESKRALKAAENTIYDLVYL